VTPKNFNLIIDFEATSVEPTTARIIEVGAMIVDDNWQERGRYSAFVLQREVLPLPEEITRITHITDQMLEAQGIPLRKMFEELAEFLSPVGTPDYIVAYNREYDETLYNTEFQRLYSQFAGQNHWVCAMRDLEVNYNFKCWKLSHLALDHGLAVDPNGLHRAINDVELTRRMLEKLAVPASAMFEFQQMPWTVLQAKIPKPWEDGGKGKSEAVKLGYAWETPRGSKEKFEKCWVKQVKQNKLDEEIKRAPFKVAQL
jgi:DNA polymerase-3 subunit epsilon